MNDLTLYKELISFCNDNSDDIESKFERKLKFNSFNEECFQKMYLDQKNQTPKAPKVLKEEIPNLAKCYKGMGFKYMRKRNKMVKGLDIQLGQWYEKALRMFLISKGINVEKKGFPYPDFVVNSENPKAYYELKYIEAPFLTANHKIKNTFPYDTTRYDYECSLTLDTGKKLHKQREKYENDIMPEDIPFYYLWWFDAPHLKGLFFMPAKEVFDYWDKVGTLHDREIREGDLMDHQEKGKIYPPLLKMESISSFLSQIS